MWSEAHEPEESYLNPGIVCDFGLLLFFVKAVNLLEGCILALDTTLVKVVLFRRPCALAVHYYLLRVYANPRHLTDG